jgi:hypothetical protein
VIKTGNMFRLTPLSGKDSVASFNHKVNKYNCRKICCVWRLIINPDTKIKNTAGWNYRKLKYTASLHSSCREFGMVQSVPCRVEWVSSSRKDVEVISVQTGGFVHEFTWMGWGKPRKPSFSVVTLRAEIRTGDHPSHGAGFYRLNLDIQCLHIHGRIHRPWLHVRFLRCFRHLGLENASGCD